MKKLFFLILFFTLTNLLKAQTHYPMGLALNGDGMTGEIYIGNFPNNSVGTRWISMRWFSNQWLAFFNRNIRLDSIVVDNSSLYLLTQNSNNYIRKVNITDFLQKSDTISVLATQNWTTNNMLSQSELFPGPVMSTIAAQDAIDSLDNEIDNKINKSDTLTYSATKTWTNSQGFLKVESDPIWSGVSPNYRTKTQNDLLYQPIGSYVTSEIDGSVTNEIQTLSLTPTDTLKLSSGGNIKLPYIKSSDLTTALSAYTTTSTLNSLLAAKQNTITLTTTGTSGSATLVGSTLNIPNYSAASAPGNTNFSAYASGTVYSLTSTSQKITFGTTSPTITITSPGTYIIYADVRLAYNGLASVGARTSTVKIRRTNNTPTDLTSATSSFVSPIISVLSPLTSTAGDCDIPVIIYTTSNSNDILELWGVITGGVLAAGSMDIQEASIVAIKIY